jgi:uncharacterized protein YbbC (DUF1343 family)
MPHGSLSIRILALSVVLPALPLSCSPAQSVRPGIDVLLTDSVGLIAGRRLGLLTNATGVDEHGVSTVDRLRTLATTELLILFAPEHHFAATLRPGETFGDTVDAATGLAIYSLYGERRAPTRAQLDPLDVLVVDLQDVGVRTYTYISTVIEVMRAARAAGKRVIVLDRPNPIGCGTAGPVLDTAHASFIGMLPIPLRHGLTMGELARFANDRLGIGADLVVVPVQGWRRCQWLDATGLPFVPPSPNLQSLEALAWYPGTVLFEATNLSVGRGTGAAFRQLGAPWLDAAALAALLSRRGIRVDTVTFTPLAPGDGKYADVAVRGIRFGAASRRDPAQPIQVVQAVMDAVRALHPDSLQVEARGLTIRLGVDPSAVRDWGRTPPDWPRLVAPFLLYR